MICINMNFDYFKGHVTKPFLQYEGSFNPSRNKSTDKPRDLNIGHVLSGLLCSLDKSFDQSFDWYMRVSESKANIEKL